jgi:hypothetical protein
MIVCMVWNLPLQIQVVVVSYDPLLFLVVVQWVLEKHQCNSPKVMPILVRLLERYPLFAASEHK